ncbi:unnamed protein product [Phyllotreta striolata]|uniref:Cytochrome P450 monooxygenase n=1 Tax=Phyllotreta striolata TaxID=444603 RepID=A0A9N9XKP0_PHYSR|nr:unnamed protein product [Phyllotreta striolata]
MDHVDSTGPQHQLQKYLLETVSIISLIWCLNHLWTRRKLYWYGFLLPGPVPLPLIGSSYALVGSSNDVLDNLVSLQDRWDTCKIWLRSTLFILVSNPRHIEIILNGPQSMDKDLFVYEPLTEVLGNGLVTAPGKIWKRHRRTIAPSFNQKILESFVRVFEEKAKLLGDKIGELVGEKGIDWYPVVARCTLDIVCETAMGVDMKVQSRNHRGIGECLATLMETANRKIFDIYYMNPVIWKLSNLKRTYDENIKYYFDITAEVIKQKKSELTDTRQEDHISPNKPAFLDLLLENSNFTEDELNAEIRTFLAAGTETTAASICAVLTTLGMFPDVQEKVYEEIVQVVGGDGYIEAGDLPRLKYTERVIKETLRLFPVAPVYARSIAQDVSLDGKVVPAGSAAVVLPIYVHRSPKYWKDPLKFDPDRFLPEESSKRHPCTYLPFSYGLRNCIGSKYALMSIKTILSTLIRRFRVYSEYKTVEEIELKLQMLLKFKDGFKISFEYR